MKTSETQLDNNQEPQVIRLPDRQVYYIQEIQPKYCEYAFEIIDKNNQSLKSIVKQCQDRIKQLIPAVEKHWNQVRDKIKSKIMELKVVKQHMKIDTSMLPKLQDLMENLKLENKTLDDKKLDLQLEIESNVQTILDHKNRIQRLVEQLNMDILKNYEPPQSGNNNNYIYNWILGCPYHSKHNIIEYCDLNNIQDLPSPIDDNMEYQNPIKKKKTRWGMSIKCCGSHKRSKQVPTYQPSKTDLKWRAFIHQIYLQGGHINYQIKSFRHQLQQLLPQCFTPLQVMLNEELLNEKNNILKAIYEIDVKDQIRILINICEIAQEIYILTSTGKWTQNQQAKSQILKTQAQNNLTIKQLWELIITIETKQKIVQQFNSQIDKAIQHLQDTLQQILRIIEQNRQPEQEIKLRFEQLQNDEAMELVNNINNQFLKLEYGDIPDEEQPINALPDGHNPHLVSSEIEFNNAPIDNKNDQHYDAQFQTLQTSQNPTASNIWRTLFPNSNKTTQRKDIKGQILLESK